MRTRKPKSKPVDQRSACANYQRRNRAQGLCRACPEKCDINPRTKKSYHYCRVHRPIVAERMRAVMRRRAERRGGWD